MFPSANSPSPPEDVQEDENAHSDYEDYAEEDDSPHVHSNDGTELPQSFRGRANRHRNRTRKPPRKLPVLGVGDRIGEGDSRLVLGILPDDLAKVAFERLKQEVGWNTMYHRGGEVPRLVAVEGEVEEDGSFPVYRHPADESPPLRPWSPTVALIREHVQQVLQHPVNHVLIQLYRNGKDAISEHSDKTIDVVRGSNIVNVSVGAQRTMTLKAKKDWPKPEAPPVEAGQVQTKPPREAQKIPLPHNSMFVMGPQTNARWLHSINPDNRPLRIKSDEEQAYNGERISLTFRHIGTFLTKDETMIYGQGATGKTRPEAKRVINGSESESSRLIQAFGEENHRSDFDWDATYGQGFDVLHFSIVSS
ncbi:hypothetical protein AX16_003344 [Volvariella volvacea WC 439]|nr:hypothetical protein AX16_003344 [Volvariella volvacea WC 439]